MLCPQNGDRIAADVRVTRVGGSSSHTQSSQMRRFREDAHFPAGCRRNLGTMNASAYGFLAGLGQQISAIPGDDRETCYLFQ